MQGAAAVLRAHGHQGLKHQIWLTPWCGSLRRVVLTAPNLSASGELTHSHPLRVGEFWIMHSVICDFCYFHCCLILEKSPRESSGLSNLVSLLLLASENLSFSCSLALSGSFLHIPSLVTGLLNCGCFVSKSIVSPNFPCWKLRCFPARGRDAGCCPNPLSLLFTGLLA